MTNECKPTKWEFIDAESLRKYSNPEEMIEAITKTQKLHIFVPQICLELASYLEERAKIMSAHEVHERFKSDMAILGMTLEHLEYDFRIGRSKFYQLGDAIFWSFRDPVKEEAKTC